MSHKTKNFMGIDKVFSVTDRINELTASMVVVLMMRIIIITTKINIFYTF